jgi:hypothetical protein
LFVVCGCADTKKPPTATDRRPSASERQDQALLDPFGYGPQDEPSSAAPAPASSDMPTVSGGKTGEFDRKAFQRDLDRVLNP